MSRDFAHTNTTIWQDDDWRGLPYPAQYLYHMLWTHPSLNYCGVADWRPARLVPLAGGLSMGLIERLADCLEARYFIVRDEDSEEVLLRSWVRWDGLMRQPRMAVSWVKAYAQTASNTIRGVVVHEGLKLREREPELSCWRDDRVVSLLRNRATDARDLPPVSDPFAQHLPIDLARVCDPFGVNATSGLGSVSTPPTPAPTPAPYSIAPSVREFVTEPTSDEPPENDAPRSTAEVLLGEWLTFVGNRKPPKAVINQVGRQLTALLSEGIDPRQVKAGLIAWSTKGGTGPGAIPGFVHEVTTKRANGSRRQADTDTQFDQMLKRAAEREAAEQKAIGT